MTGYRSKHFRWNCHEKRQCYNDTLPSWDYLMEAFPRGIIPTDVDGMVEINGSFLFIEQKRAGAFIPEGQRMALLRLAALSDNVTVLIIREIADSADMEVARLKRSGAKWWERMTRDELMVWMKSWATAVDA